MSKLIDEELYIDVSVDNLNAVDHLNAMQKYAFDLILEKVFARESGFFFVDGPGGTG